MFIDRNVKPNSTPFGGAEWFWSGWALLEFRSSERSHNGIARSSINMSPLTG